MEITTQLHKPDDNWTSLGYSTHQPTSNYYYPIDPIAEEKEKKKKPYWLIQAEADRQLFEDWLQKKVATNGSGSVGCFDGYDFSHT